MNIIRRLKNLWILSAFHPKLDEHDRYYARNIELLKDFPTIKHKPATIIKEPIDYFQENVEAN